MRTEYKEGDLLTKEDIGLVFKTKGGQEFKIVCLCEKTEYITLVNNAQCDSYKILNLNGKHDGLDYTSLFDLVSFVGPDFTEDKKLRRFEFEAYLGENPCSPPFEHNTVQLAVGHYTTILHNDFLTLESAVNNTGCNNISKWKITMKELPND